MSAAAPYSSPQLGEHATPLSVFTFDGPEPLWSHLGLTAEGVHPTGDGLFGARVEVPPGEWIIWTERNFVMWIGDHAEALPDLSEND